jgi:hypothetical protein
MKPETKFYAQVKKNLKNLASLDWRILAYPALLIYWSIIITGTFLH